MEYMKGKWNEMTGRKNEIEDEIDRKEQRWLENHTLNINEKYRQPLEFVRGKCLILGFHDDGAECRQWFVTDKQSTIEFYEVGSNEKVVIIHNKPQQNYIIAEEFVCDDGVLERMNEVLGTTNYSLVLRNSEHVARYIHSGAWISHQMVSGKLREQFNKEMTKTVQHLINTNPEELVKVKICDGSPLYPEIKTDYIKFEKHIDVLSEAGKDNFNIVLLGITGSGKSSLINLLFNEEVARSAATPVSVTRNVYYIQGTYMGTPDITDDENSKSSIIKNDKIEFGSDPLNVEQSSFYEPKEDFLQSPKVPGDYKAIGDPTDSMIQILNDIQSTETELEKKRVHLEKMLQNSYLTDKQTLRSKIAERVKSHEHAICLHTKSIELLNQYEAELKETDDRRTINQVCVVDTVGLCDTLFTSKQVYEKISKSVNTHMAFIDKVIIICSGRIEKSTADSIKQFMDWMEYETHQKNFVFVYNKCDEMSDAERDHSLVSMCELLDVDIEVEDILTNPDGSRQAVKYAQATSFPPNVEYSAIKEDLDTLKQAIFAKPNSRILIKAESSQYASCTII